MKSAKEILRMLIYELVSYLPKPKSAETSLIYYNETLGDTSFLLAGLLNSLLEQNFKEWNSEAWIDDSLITNIIKENNELIIEGVMILGKLNTTEQWTAPFSFRIELLKEDGSYKEFMFLFGDLYHSEITYEDYIDNRGYWLQTRREWKYIIRSNEILI